MAEQTPTPKQILIVRLGAMGDVLHAMPAAAALRNALPDASIGWVIERRWAELLVSGDGAHATTGPRPLVDALHVVDTLNWRKQTFARSTWHELRRATDRLRSRQYDIAVDVQGAIKSALIAKLARAKSVIGLATPREHAATLFYRRKVSVTTKHVIDQNLELCSFVSGVRLAAGEFDLPRSAQAERWCGKKLSELAIGRYAILNPGSGWGAKSWPAERFAGVARKLRERGLSSIINFGPQEQELAEKVAALSEGAAVPVFCSVTELVALTRRAALFIGGDTGPLHLAAALKVPVVALFGPTDPARNGPYGTAAVVLRSEQSVTSYSHVGQADPGLQAITTEQVLEAALPLLGAHVG